MANRSDRRLLTLPFCQALKEAAGMSTTTRRADYHQGLDFRLARRPSIKAEYMTATASPLLHFTLARERGPYMTNQVIAGKALKWWGGRR